MTPLSAAETPEAVHQSALVIDTHADTPQRLLDDDFDLAAPLGEGHFNFDTASRGNLGAQFFAIWSDPRRYTRHAERSLQLIESVRRQTALHPDRMTLATSPDDIEPARAEGKLAVLLAIEGGHSIEDSLDLLREYHRLGARYMTLTWANSTGWAESSGDQDDPSLPHPPDGLAPFGVEVIAEMNRLGMMVDVSHVSDRTFHRVRDVSRAPIFASHSAARALTNSARNLTDDMLRAIAHSGPSGSGGGVVMVNFYSAFISESWRAAWTAQVPAMAAAERAQISRWTAEGRRITYDMISALDKQWASRIPRPPLRLLIDHIDHIAKIAGIDHVGLGSDFDGIPSTPQGLDFPADLPKITAALISRGYSADDCRKILGLNFLRFFREVQDRATAP